MNSKTSVGNEELQRLKKEINIKEQKIEANQRGLVSFLLKKCSEPIKEYAEAMYKIQGKGYVYIIEKEEILESKLGYYSLKSMGNKCSLEKTLKSHINIYNLAKEVPIIVILSDKTTHICSLPRQLKTQKAEPVGFGILKKKQQAELIKAIAEKLARETQHDCA